MKPRRALATVLYTDIVGSSERVSERSRAGSSTAIALIAVIAASTVAGWLVFTELVLARPLPKWDEGSHALQGALITHDLSGGHLLALLFDTYRQIYWTPLNSWFVAVAFLVAGISMEAARAVSTVSYVLLAPTTFFLAWTVEPRRGAVAGTFAAALALTLPGIVEHAALAMLEIPGLVAISGTILLECRLERCRDDRPRRHAWVGLGVVLTYLIKANYGILLGIVLVLGRWIRVGSHPRRLWTRESLIAALPVLLFAALWFAYPPKVQWTWNALVNQPWGGVDPWSAAGLLFFPRALIALAGSWWMATLLVSGVAWAWTLRDRPGIPLLALLPILLFVIGELHHTKLERHMLPMFPSMCVLTGVAGARLLGWLQGKRPRGIVLGGLALATLAFLHGRVLAEREWIEPNDGEWRRLLDHVSRETRETPALVIRTNAVQPRPPIIEFDLVARGQLPATRAAVAMDLAFHPRYRADLQKLPQGFLRSALRFQLDRYYAPAPLRSLAADDRNPTSRARFERLLASTLRRDPHRTIVVLTDDPAPRAIQWLTNGLPERGFRQVSVREFSSLETWVYVYRKPWPAPPRAPTRTAPPGRSHLSRADPT